MNVTWLHRGEKKKKKEYFTVFSKKYEMFFRNCTERKPDSTILGQGTAGEFLGPGLNPLNSLNSPFH